MSRVSAVLAALIFAIIGLTMMGTLHAQEASAQPPKLIFLFSDHFEGWTCVDFGVASAAPLPREGNSFLVRTRPGDVVKTSDKLAGYFIYSEGWLEINGTRRPLPEGVFARRQTPTSDSRDPVQRYCVFFGSEDESDAAGSPPGVKPDPPQGVSAQEREALIALYKATNGDHWEHRIGWLGPPGTECQWHGVECWSGLNPKPQQVTGIDLMENNLVGLVPNSVGTLTHLEELSLRGNHLSGVLPQSLIQKWLLGNLRVIGDASLLTDISKIEYEVDPSALLCGFHYTALDSEGYATRYETHCRNATPDDRTTYCEVKEGKSWGSGFATLAWVLEKNGFFHLNPEYSGNMTDAAFVTTRATRNEKLYSVEEYSFGAPFELDVIHLAIEGFESSQVEWEKTSTRPECPASMVRQK